MRHLGMSVTSLVIVFYLERQNRTLASFGASVRNCIRQRRAEILFVNQNERVITRHVLIWAIFPLPIY